MSLSKIAHWSRLAPTDLYIPVYLLISLYVLIDYILGFLGFLHSFM